MRIDSRSFLDWYAPRRKRFEWGFWIVLYLVNAGANSAVRVLELDAADPIAPWEPVLWESSSALALLLLVWPVVVFTRHWSWSWSHPIRWLAGHFVASVVFSLAHVLLMIAMREAAYRLAGGDYNFGHWPSELVYEYLKDARTYAGVVLFIEGYRFILRRLAGEARWLDAPPDDLQESSSGDAEADGPTDYCERFLIKMLGREFLVPAADIDYAQAAGNYVNLVVGGREYPLRSTMKGLIERLDPERFRRVHRSYLVRLDRIAEIEPLDSGDARLKLVDGTELPCSRSYRSTLT
jgi:hypothetical protein